MEIFGDIQSMFHLVKVPTENCDLQRFMWWEDGLLKNDLRSYQMCGYHFGTVSSPSCANFALKQMTMDYEKESSFAAINTGSNCFYIDDCITSAPTSTEATALLYEIC